MRKNITELVSHMFAGEEHSLSRLISLIERESLDVPMIMEMISSHLGRGYCIGITGAPGSGKSTLVDKLAAAAGRKGSTVGIIAVDPSSPRTGGATLGDRIRMQQHLLNEGVFIRSMATRGSHGGLSKAVHATVNLMDAFGKDIIIVETVGVGQADVRIMEVAHTVGLILTPESGDFLQFMKAGIMEVADMIIVNKADRDGCERFVAELKDILAVNPGAKQQTVFTTQAVNNVGVEELFQELETRRSGFHKCLARVKTDSGGRDV